MRLAENPVYQEHRNIRCICACTYAVFTRHATVVLCHLQELHVFLEADTPLGANLQWQQLQPMHGSILEGVARLPKQLFGMLLPSQTDVMHVQRKTLGCVEICGPVQC